MASSARGRFAGSVEAFVDFLKRLFVAWPSSLSVFLTSLMLLFLPQVADLLARPFTWGDYTLLIAGIMVFWLIPVHLGARILLDAQHIRENAARAKNGDPQQPRSKLDIWLPRLLPLITILVLGITIHRQMNDYAALAENLPLATSIKGVALQLYSIPFSVFVLFVIYLIAREGAKKGWISGLKATVLTIAFSTISIAMVVAAGVSPIDFAELFSGLLYFPMLGGSWIMPLVGLIALLHSGHTTRRWVQFATTFVIGTLVSVTWFTDNQFHDLRLLEADKVTATEPAQFTLAEYIGEWKRRNHCDDLENIEHKRCQAIFVTAEGGASRAAYQVATVLGGILDNPPGENFREKLFLFSGVSGGSLGLATARQALADSTNGAPPCKKYEGAASKSWIYGNSDAAAEAKTKWQKCLQLLVSGDYLTPAVVGLTLRDWWMGLPALLGWRFEDRSTLLEKAIEQHYDAVVDTKCADGKGLCTPFGHLERGNDAKPWLPALMLNGTLVERGQGVVISDIDPSSDFPEASECRKHAKREYPTHVAYSDAMPIAYDLFELMDPRRKEDRARGPKVIHDIRLSTAIATSARFPVISNRANIRARVKKDPKASNEETTVLVGQIVDGGYFDNSGLSGISDMIDALDCFNVDSIVINIRNNPLDDNLDRLWWFPERENPRQPLLEAADKKLDVSFSPIQALLNSGEGHVIESRYSTIGRVTSPNYISSNIYKAICLGKVAKDGYCPENGLELQRLSMSWWLSPFVQGFIELQDKDNIRKNNCSSHADLHCRSELMKDLEFALAHPTILKVQTTPATCEKTSQPTEQFSTSEGLRLPRWKGLDGAIRPYAE